MTPRRPRYPGVSRSIYLHFAFFFGDIFRVGVSPRVTRRFPAQMRLRSFRNRLLAIARWLTGLQR